MKRLLATAFLLAAAGCKPAIKCGADGFIIVPPGMSLMEKADADTKNLDLATRRLNDATGAHAVQYNRASLDKAEGCP